MVTESKYGLTQSDIKKITAVFAQHPEIIEAVLYGSRALGRFRNGSDIDLTLKGDISLNLLFEIETELDDLLLPYKIDLSIFKTISNPDLIDHINRVGKVFFKRWWTCQYLEVILKLSLRLFKIKSSSHCNIASFVVFFVAYD